MKRCFIPLFGAVVILLSGCNGTREEKPQEISADFTYLEQSAYEYADRYLRLPDDQLRRQDFLLDVRARIDRLYYEVSPTHAMLFEKAFADSAGLDPKI